LFIISQQNRTVFEKLNVVFPFPKAAAAAAKQHYQLSSCIANIHFHLHLPFSSHLTLSFIASAK